MGAITQALAASAREKGVEILALAQIVDVFRRVPAAA
jgi:hypothetical protein